MNGKGSKTKESSVFRRVERMAIEWQIVLHGVTRHANLNRVFGEHAANWIDKRLGDSARIACLSAGAFSRLIRRIGGTSYHRLREQGHLLSALHHIESTEDSITEIAFRIGFGSLWGLERAFRSHLGCTPLKYRRLFRIRQRKDFPGHISK